MKRWQVTLTCFGALALLGVVLNGNEDPETWAALFWVSAVGNCLLVLLLHSTRQQKL